ncbi:MAG: tRNA lysidine(34) synthetase TilS [Solirubrobacterales bacterium]
MAKVQQVVPSIRQTGLVPAGARVLVLLSGGADSVCLLHALRELLGPDRVGALHINHGLRAEADRDQRFCAELCRTLSVPCVVEQVDIDASAGNTEALARDARYAAAEKVRAANRYGLIATGHTASDQAETVLYRLVSSPGRRSLLGIAERNGPVIRPLLSVTREQTRDHCRQAGLEWREDESNRDTSLARNRLRHEVLPALREIHPAASENIVATAAELREESELLDAAVDEAVDRCGATGIPPTIEASQLAALAPPLRRLVLRRLAERAAGRPVALGPSEARELERLAEGPGSSYLDLGEGVRAACEYGVIRFIQARVEEKLDPVALHVPGSCRFGAWEVVCELEQEPAASLARQRSEDEATLDTSKLAATLQVRGWVPGDRISPLGLNGSKSLQDVFTDRKIPRSLRAGLPIVVSEGEVAWIAGVATSERFKVSERTRSAVRLRARMTAAS